MYQDFTVRIHSCLADLQPFAKALAEQGHDVERHGYATMMLYYFCSGIDAKQNEDGTIEKVGSGRVTFDINVAAAYLGKTIATIKDYLVNGIKIGVFHSVKRCKNLVTVRYASIHRIAAKYGLDRLGVFAEIPLSDLKHLRFWATQLTAQHLQNSSRYFAGLKLPKGEKVAQPEDLLLIPYSYSGTDCTGKCKSKADRSEQVSSQWGNNVVYRSDRYIFVDRHFIPFGVSQPQIADYQGRHKSTVHRRLNNNERMWIGQGEKRRDRGIDFLPQVQIAKFIGKVGDGKKSTFDMMKESDPIIGANLDKYFWSAGGVWEAKANIYERQFTIRSGKSSKFWYRRKLELGILKYPDRNTGDDALNPALKYQPGASPQN